jgi:hypothetical protein
VKPSATRPLPLELDLPTSAEDIAALRRARRRTIDPATIDWKWLSLSTQFPHLERRRRTHRGFADFELVSEPASPREIAK